MGWGAPTMVTYVVDLKKLVKVTFRLIRRFDVKEHFSKSKNEQFSVHQMLLLFVLFCLLEKPIDRFGELVKIMDLRILELKRAPHYSTMWRAWSRFSPRFLRKLVQLTGDGGRENKQYAQKRDEQHFSWAYRRTTSKTFLRKMSFS